MHQLINTLRAITPLSDGLTDFLIQSLKVKELNKKDHLLKAGMQSNEVYYIKSGLLRCYYDINDVEVSSWFLKEGDVAVSVESFFKKMRGNEYIQALEPTTLYYITRSELERIYSEFHESNIISRALTAKYFVLSEQRTYSLHLPHAQDRYDYFVQKEPELLQRVSSKYIASYLKIHPAHFSEIKRKR